MAIDNSPPDWQRRKALSKLRNDRRQAPGVAEHVTAPIWQFRILNWNRGIFRTTEPDDCTRRLEKDLLLVLRALRLICGERTLYRTRFSGATGLKKPFFLTEAKTRREEKLHHENRNTTPTRRLPLALPWVAGLLRLGMSVPAHPQAIERLVGVWQNRMAEATPSGRGLLEGMIRSGYKKRGSAITNHSLPDAYDSQRLGMDC